MCRMTSPREGRILAAGPVVRLPENEQSLAADTSDAYLLANPRRKRSHF